MEKAIKKILMHSFIDKVVHKCRYLIVNGKKGIRHKKYGILTLTG